MEKDLTAYVMCGPQGGGKSTKAKEIAALENAVIIEGDKIREELFGSAEIQGNWVDVHDRIEEILSESCGMSVILDGTYWKKSYRAEAIALLKSYGYDKIEAIVCCPSLDTCMERNWSRDRNVPDYALRVTYDGFQRESKDILSEGFDRVTFVY
jgi:predicted kinase